MPPDESQPPVFELDEGALRAALMEKSPGSFTEEERAEQESVLVVEAAENTEPDIETVEPEKSDAEASPSLEESLAAAAQASEEKPVEKQEPVKEATSETPKHPDLEDDVKKLDPHTKPRTRQIIEGIKAKAIAERERAVKAEQSRAELEKQYNELKTQAESSKPSKAIEDEITTLRERVRELDVTKDPAIEAKYDKPITANTDAAIGLMGEMGFFKVKEGEGKYRDMTDKEKAAVTNQIKSAGVGIRSMAQHIKALENAGEVEAAEQLRDFARENDRLAREKNSEITQIKGDFEGRAKVRAQQQQQEQAQIQEITRATSEKTISADLAEIAKTFPQVVRPPEPTATDPAPVVASKKAAIAEYETAQKQVAESAAMFNEAGLSPPKAAEARGRIIASAVQAVIIKNHILPRMVKEQQAQATRIKELQSQVDGFKKAGNLNRAHAASITSGTSKPAGGDVSANASFTDALAANLKAAGVDTSS